MIEKLSKMCIYQRYRNNRLIGLRSNRFVFEVFKSGGRVAITRVPKFVSITLDLS